MKLVINKCFGGFSLSHDAVMLYAKLSGFNLYAFVDADKPDGSLDFGHFEPYHGGDPFTIHYSKSPLNKNRTYNDGDYFSDRDIDRADPNLIKVVNQLGEKSNGRCAQLSVIEIPDGVDYEIDEYDGLESIHEKHRSWS